MPQIGHSKFLATPVENNVFSVKFESFKYEMTINARTAWTDQREVNVSGALC